MLHDISRPLAAGMEVWPGDTAFRFEQNSWGTVRVGAMTLSLHSGTHADAPSHFDENGATVDALDPAVHFGPATVVDVRGVDIIEPENVGRPRHPRILLRTDSWPDGAPFPSRIPVVTLQTVEHLARLGACLLGVDVPSVDPIDSKTLDNHHSLHRAGIHILESLDLAQVPPGDYFLSALPLKITGGDASPVRAILAPLDPAPKDYRP
jgi:arylformamidase